MAARCKRSPVCTSIIRCRRNSGPSISSTRGISGALQEFRSSELMGLVRNYRRVAWLVTYLFGASPALCRSFRPDGHELLTELDSRDLVRAVCDVAAHERLGLPEQDAGSAQHPRELAGRVPIGHPQRRHDGGAALRGDRRRRRRRVSPAQREHPANRERVLQHDSSEAEQSEQVTVRSSRSPKPASTTSRCARST